VGAGGKSCNNTAAFAAGETKVGASDPFRVNLPGSRSVSCEKASPTTIVCGMRRGGQAKARQLENKNSAADNNPQHGILSK
jgi:hypothetical protein